jgi:hypothetical protein
LCPSCRTVWERALGESYSNKQVRQPPTSPQSRRQIYPGRTTYHPTPSITVRLRAYTCTCNPTLQTTAICSVTSKHLQQQVK